MKLPTLLESYLEETEQDPEEMTSAELCREAEWVLWNAKNDAEGIGERIYPSQIRALERFIASQE